MTVCRRCGYCKGTGLLPSKALTNAFEALTDAWQTTAQIGDALELDHTNVDDSLQELHAQGLTERRVRRARGGGYEWRRVQKSG